MTMHDYAKKSQFAALLNDLYQAEANGANTYYVFAYLAKEKGYDDVYEALMQNAAEDAFHGGRYGAMLGKGEEDEAKFWQMLRAFYAVEAGAEPKLNALVSKVRLAGEAELAFEIEKSIKEENEHARRLMKVLKAHGQKID